MSRLECWPFNRRLFNFIEKKHLSYHWVESLLYSFDLSGSGWCRDVCNQGRHEWKSHEWTFVLKNCNATYYLVLIGKNNHLFALKTYLLLFFALIWEVNCMTIWLKPAYMRLLPRCISAMIFLAFICCGWTKVRPKKTVFLVFHSYNHISLSHNFCGFVWKKRKKSK